jgi:RNA binding exosome subunit
MEKAEIFVSDLLVARDAAHIAHWKTTSYAEHKALQEFYEAILELTDQFVEQYQGYYGERMDINQGELDNSFEIKKLLESCMEWIETNRYEICDKSETPLQNTIDEVVRQFQSTLYMLTLK